MTAARRLAAILAADVVGYSRLMGEDEAERERREAAEPNTANLRQRIVKAPSLAPRSGVQISSFDKSSNGGAPGSVMSAQLFRARGQPTGLRREVKHRLGRLDSLLGLENGQEIKRADFNNPLAITNDDAFQDGRFLAQHDAPLVTHEPVGLLDHFHCRAFAEIGLTKVRDGRARRVEGLVWPSSERSQSTRGAVSPTR